MKISYHVLAHFLFYFCKIITTQSIEPRLQKWIRVIYIKKRKFSIKLSTTTKLTSSWVSSREKNTSDWQVDGYPESCTKITHSIAILTSITKSSRSNSGPSLLQLAIPSCMSGISSWPIKIKVTLIEKYVFFVFSTSMEKRKVPVRNWTSDHRIPRS